MNEIVPRAERVQTLLTEFGEGPVVMLNLLKFKDRAAGGEGTGAEAYRRYGDAVVRLVAEHGGRVVWIGQPTHVLIGDASQEWDAVALVEYPSVRAFVEMGLSREYQAIHKFREDGLARTVLIACRALPAGI